MKTIQDQTFELLQVANLNWTVRKTPLITADGIETKSYGIIRNTDNKWLGTVGEKYTPLQNFEIAEAIVEASYENGLEFSRGGQLSGGRRVYLQAELPSAFIGKSAVKRWITSLNSHDASKGAGFGTTNVTVICQNTYNMAMRELSHLRHTATIQARLKLASEGLRDALIGEDAVIRNFKAMAEVRLTDSIFGSVMKKVFDIDLDVKRKDVTPQTAAKLDKISKSIERELNDEGTTLWGLFNGITRFTNHHAVDVKKKDEYLMLGAGYNTNLVGYNEIMRWVEENTIAQEFVMDTK